MEEKRFVRTGMVKGRTLALFIGGSVVAAILTFPFPVSVFANGIDPPLAWVFNFLINGHIELSKEFVFPHGQLAFIMYPLTMGPNFWIAISIHLVLRITMAFALIKLTTNKPAAFTVMAFISAVVLLAFNDILLTAIELLILCYLNFFERRNVWWLIPALILTPVFLFVKAFVGIVCLVIAGTFFIIMIYRCLIGIESFYRLFLFLILPFVGYFVWILMFGNLSGISYFLKGMIQLAGDNSAAASIYPQNNWWLLIIGMFSGISLIIQNRKEKAVIRYFALVGPAIFAIWKYGMAREDNQHALVLAMFILFFVLIFNLLIKKFKISNLLFTVIIIVAFLLNLKNAFYFEKPVIHFNGILKTGSAAFHYRNFKDTCSESSSRSIERNILDRNIRKLIGNSTADVYPWDYSYIAANKLNWQPRPVLQSYASYTRDLDDLNSSHFRSSKAPEFLIWELQKITHDIHGGNLESIDGRYLLNDEPDALISMISFYHPVARQEGIFPAIILKKRNLPLQRKETWIGQSKTTWNQWIDVPDEQLDLIRASVDMKTNLLGRVKSFFYKNEAFYVYYLMESGEVRMYRMVPKNAAYGLWINPLFLDASRENAESKVQKIMFRCSDTRLMKQPISVVWEKSIFSYPAVEKNTKQGINPIYEFFGKKVIYTENQHFVSINNLRKQELFWSNPDKVNLKEHGTFLAQTLPPGGYSCAFEFPLDSLNFKDIFTRIMIRASCWALGSSGSKGVYVISVEQNNTSLVWKAVDINPFLHDRFSANLVTDFCEIDSSILSQNDIIIKVYAWNTGNIPFETGNFRVSFENITYE